LTVAIEIYILIMDITFKLIGIYGEKRKKGTVKSAGD
jgi:hypothetical protein